MSGLAATGPNAEMIEYWNATSGPKWVAMNDRIDAQIAPLGALAIDWAAPASGERVLDVGCGCGPTCLALAERVGERGSVLGVDISTPMLERARECAARAGCDQVSFANADAQIHRFDPGSRDLVFSRFGVMFFADPAAAFANLRSALREGGRLVFVCWRALAENAWMREPVGAIAGLVELPAPPAPDAPGPFSFADADRVRSILERAGFTDVGFEAVDHALAIGGRGATLDEAVGFALNLGPAAAILREADDALRERAATAVREALAPFATDAGVVLDSAAWIVTASNPG